MFMRTLVLKATRACNLRCAYCYYINKDTEDYGSRFSEDLVARLYSTYAAHVDGKVDRVSLIWHGGEPLALGRKRFQTFLDMQADYFRHTEVANRLQTNGTLIDDAWAEFFLRNSVSVGVSIDGPREQNDQIRVFGNGRGSFDRVMRGVEVLRRHEVPFGVLTVADPAVGGADLIRFLQENAFYFSDVLIPMTNHALQAGDAAVDVRAVGTTLLSAFRAWAANDDPRFQIRLFHALLLNAVGGRHNCANAGLAREALGAYAIVETDGDICFDTEFSEIDRHGVGSEYRTGFNLMDPGFSFTEAADHIEARMLDAEMHQIPRDCDGCHVKTICRGSHPGSRYSGPGDFAHRSAYCEALMPLCEEVAGYLRDNGYGEVMLDSRRLEPALNA